MHLVVLGLALLIFMHDQMADPAVLPTDIPMLLLDLLGAKLVVMVFYWAVCQFTLKRLGKGNTNKALNRLGMLGWVYRIALLKLFAFDLFSGMLVWVRHTVGDWVLIDEMIVAAPTIGMLLFFWWAYYPIDRRLREASLLGQIERGQPIYPIWTRWQFVLCQLRHQVLLIAVPLAALIAWTEALNFWADDLLPEHLLSWTPTLSLVGAGVIFVLAPAIIRMVWDTAPLPDGPLRDRLMHMCTRHRVGVRALLIWKTFGGMINAAVMGIIAPVRYILLTDALIDQLPDDQIEAVMAHELGHVRKHHMFWLLLAAMVLLMSFQTVYGVLMFGLFTVLPEPPTPEQVAGWWGDAQRLLLSQQALEVCVTLLTLLSWLLGFGWVSRRFERQADTFAVAHLAEREATHVPAEVSPQAAYIMIQALGQVAELNHIPTRKRSWRHGSIHWRQAYLSNLIGKTTDKFSIDRTVRWVNLIMLLLAAGLAAVQFYYEPLAAMLYDMMGVPMVPVDSAEAITAMGNLSTTCWFAASISLLGSLMKPAFLPACPPRGEVL